jgi:hypothetical protein
MDSSKLVQHLMKLGLYDQNAITLISQIAKFFSSEHDKWLCNDCLADGGTDMPDTEVCCYCLTSFCLECLKIRNFRCECGDLLHGYENSDEKYQIHT